MGRAGVGKSSTINAFFGTEYAKTDSIKPCTDEIYIYDLRQYRNCLKKVNDYGNFYTNCMEISYDYNYIATGGKQGYVNLYSVSDLIKDLNEDVEPVKIYDNLTTSCDYVRFNKINSMLGMSSKWKKNALRFVNLENKNVFINFPSFREHMKYPFCFDFNCDNSFNVFVCAICSFS